MQHWGWHLRMAAPGGCSGQGIFFSLWIEEAALERNSAIFSFEHAAFFSLDRRGCFGAKFSDFSASNMQLFFSLWIEGSGAVGRCVVVASELGGFRDCATVRTPGSCSDCDAPVMSVMHLWCTCDAPVMHSPRRWSSSAPVVLASLVPLVPNHAPLLHLATAAHPPRCDAHKCP